MDIKDLEQEIIRLSRKYNIKKSEVEKIYNYQFKRIMQIIAEDKNKDIRERRSIKVRGLGTFRFNPYVAKKITNQKIEKYEREVLRASENPEDGNRNSTDQSNG